MPKINPSYWKCTLMPSALIYVFICDELEVRDVFCYIKVPVTKEARCIILRYQPSVNGSFDQVIQSNRL